MTAPNDKRRMPFGGAFAVSDKLQPPPTDEFCEKYLEWIESTQNNVVVGLKDFPFKAYCNGTTEAFDKFYMKNHTRRFRCFRGEYMYHQVTWRNNWPDWEFLEDAPLESTDAVVISLPFANTGDEHAGMYNILDKCTALEIPVLIDCAYFGVCAGITFASPVRIAGLDALLCSIQAEN